MISIIGLGKAGAAIADIFSQYPQYSTYKILAGKKKGKRKNTYTVSDARL